MKLSVELQGPRSLGADLLAVLLPELDPDSWKLPARLKALDATLGGTIRAALSSGDFRGRSSDELLLYPGAEDGPARVLLLGLGDPSKRGGDPLRRAAGRAVRTASRHRCARLALWVPALRGVRAEAGAQALAEGAILGSYRFDAYLEPKADGPGAVTQVTLVYERLANPRAVRRSAAEGVILAESQNVARQLSNEPPNELPPAVLAKRAQKVAKEVGLKCRVLGVPEMRKLEMGALLAVGQGSAAPPRLVVLEHDPAAAGRGRRKVPTLCVVGKGITFDSGGLSIKPAAGMPQMKHDMSGAAAVVGILRAVALLKLPLHVVGVIAAAENMPDGAAYRPADIVRSMSGKTIEILNTDAEGRVVLADALHYAHTKFEPAAMIDLATLTGACIVALGPWATGIFGTSPALVERIRSAGEATGERSWPMPLFDEHREAMRGTAADLRNAGGRDAGASTAAGFLAAFAGDTPWVHLDIAGTADTDKPGPTQPRGATGVGVRLVTETLRRWGKGLV